MAQPASKSTTPAGRAAAADGAPVIDHDHLSRMTFGDPDLARELLQLFDRQAEILLARMRESDAAVTAALAHTLKGSAAGIGAAQVAHAAEQTERAASAAPAELAGALAHLDQTVSEARALIAQLKRGR